MTRNSQIWKQLNSSPPKQVVVIRALPGLGDFLCGVPALRALRRAIPDVKITLVGLRAARYLLPRFHQYIDEWIDFPGYFGIPEVLVCPDAIATFLNTIKQREFDLAIQLHGNGSSMNPFLLSLGAKQNAGFYPTESCCPNADTFMPYPEDGSEVWRNLRLMDFLGIPLQGSHLEFPVQPTDWKKFESLADDYNLHPEQSVCVHPGASTCDRRWPAAAFAEIADAIAARGWQIILTGTPAEIELNDAVARRMRYPAVNLAGKTDLGGLAALLKQSRLLICNDTGISHLADALQVQSIVLFSNSDANRWAPLNRQRHRIVHAPFQWKVRTIHSSLTAGISPVLMAAFDLLQEEVAYVS
jgi:ADP-heptose:LPS heptosyltransferase